MNNLIKKAPITSDADETTFVEMISTEDSIIIQLNDIHGGKLPTMRIYALNKINEANSYFQNIAEGDL